MLNWKQKVNDTSKKNVEGLMDVFDKFINQNHKSQFSYDLKIKKQWESFRKVIEADPADVESHNKYVNMLKINLMSKDDNLNRINNKLLLRFENIAPILMQINRTKLEEVAKKTSKMILKNTKTTLKL